MLSPRRAISLLLLTFMLAAGSALRAQDAAPSSEPPPAPLPNWVVLVLQPLHGERVRPVTGVVISAEGLILVPSQFAAPGDSLIVLDGGSDVINNGRAAFVQSEHPEIGLDVLSSPLLRRTPAPLSASPLTPGTEVRLGAFPPAEQIAAGAPPVWRVVKLGGGSASAFTLETGSVLPQVTGPIMDACGYLQGFHAAPMVQSLNPASSPAITWKPALAELLASVSVTLPERMCNPAAPPIPADSDTPVDTDSPEQTAAAPPIAPPGAEPTGASALASAAPSSVVTVPAKTWSSRAFWSTLLGVTVAVLLVWSWLLRKSAVTAEETSLVVPRERRQAVETVWTGRRNQPAGPGATTSDSRLEIIGKLADGTDFSAGCAINGAAFSAIVGRGKADIVIDHSSIHREHVTLGGSRDNITVSDLGSASGTWVNRVPCLAGEIFFVGEEDTVFIGDVSFRVAVKALPHPTDAGTSGS